jgi:formiminotetrahydrofolate cyclodeaminase
MSPDPDPTADTAPDYLELRLVDFLRQVGEPTPAPSAGAAAATTVALAAGLTAMSAGLSGRQLSEAERIRDRALALKDEVQQLAQRDADSYAGVLEARARPADDPDRAAAVSEALSMASEVPLRIAELGTEVLDLAVSVAGDGNPNLRGDALTAGLLAQAAVRAAAALVALNLSDEHDPQRVRAGELVARARAVELTL